MFYNGDFDEYDDYPDDILDFDGEEVHIGLDGEFEEDISEKDLKFFEDFDNTLSDIDFSDFKGDFKSSFHKVNKRIGRQTVKARKKQRPLSKSFGVKHRATIHGERGVPKTTKRILVPSDRKVIVEGVDRFILSKSPQDDAIRNIQYYEGKKLKEVVLTFNNNSALDFNLELFNPSMPLDYLQSTSLNLNDKIQVGGGNAASYTDVLADVCQNPTFLINAKFVFAGANVPEQISKPLTFINKETSGMQKAKPIQLQLQLDTMQYQSDMVFFNIESVLGRPYVPCAMDVISYSVLAGMTVTMSFYYKQISLKKVFLKEAKNSKVLM